MSIKLMSQVWSLDLTKSETLVLLALADHANDEGVCYPSRELISWKTGLHPSTVSEIVKRLECRKIIKTLRKGNQYTHSSIYKLRPQNAPEKAPFAPRQIESYEVELHSEQLSNLGENGSRISQKLETANSAVPREGCLEKSECRPKYECMSAPSIVDVGEDDPNHHESSTTPMNHQESLSYQQPVRRKADTSERESTPSRNATVFEGQIGGMRIVSGKGKMTKLLLTIAGQRCKAYGAKADGLVAKYKNGDYVHAEGYLEKSKFGEEFVTTGGWRLEPSAPQQEPSSAPSRSDDELESIMRGLAREQSSTVAESEEDKSNLRSETAPISPTPLVHKEVATANSNHQDGLIQQQVGWFRDRFRFPDADLRKRLNSPSPIARRAAEIVLAERAAIAQSATTTRELLL